MTRCRHRFPNLNFVSVESGFGWVPSFVESMDWQWLNSGAHEAYPEMELPSFYFRRQVYGMFWFETEALQRQVDLFPDNLMFETDFPHPTSLSPGPASPSPSTVGRRPEVRRGPARGTGAQDPVGERRPRLQRARNRRRSDIRPWPTRRSCTSAYGLIGRVTLNRPETMNALSETVMEELFHASGSPTTIPRPA